MRSRARSLCTRSRRPSRWPWCPRASMAYAIINKIRMHYEVSGKGDPVLLINGLGSPSVSWALQAKALAAHFTVVVFDHRGVGESDLPGEPMYSTGQLADDAGALLK